LPRSLGRWNTGLGAGIYDVCEDSPSGGGFGSRSSPRWRRAGHYGLRDAVVRQNSRQLWNQHACPESCYNSPLCFVFLDFAPERWFACFIRATVSLLENLALRQQLVVLKRLHPRPKLKWFDRLFWQLIRPCWSGWKQALLIVTPETVVRWHRAGFRWYWRAVSRFRKPIGRKPTSKEVRNLIFQMVTENPTWGAPRIHGELLMLGFDISERTVSRWMKRAPRQAEPGKRWLAFLRNHREAIAAMEFFTVPTVTFSVLYCFFAISHDRRRILHCNVTRPVGSPSR
jgi:putative transposase